MPGFFHVFDTLYRRSDTSYESESVYLVVNPQRMYLKRINKKYKWRDLDMEYATQAEVDNYHYRK